ncbi:MAG: membrane protein insertion efficiency factor YidD [Sterolibacteriaceae bacterium]|nr:membrane protein insertion efficiency factor YidD [Candidatus Methylophosphatis haderslevensis]
MRDRQATAGRTAHTAQPGPRPHAGCLVRYCGALLRALALRAIGLYQRHLSPRKGFACAYRARTGGASCSELGFRAIRRFGLRAGLRVLDARLARCRLAASLQRRRTGWPRAQAGDCDCDLPCSPFDACDDASCDWPRSERKAARRKDRKPPRLPASEPREQRGSDDVWRG